MNLPPEVYEACYENPSTVLAIKIRMSARTRLLLKRAHYSSNHKTET
jgi:hypothetical protein